jgi:2-oxoisovalerate dehydrogenase E1 component alpha subunit
MQSELLLKIYDLMCKSRLLEERLINMFKQNQGFFWIGGPGEEAFNVPLGLLIKKGQGLDYDFLHFHYRSSAILVAMGMDPLGAIRQMKNTATDPHSGGRNFSSHYSMRSWNLTPITSPIEVQYVTAIGTAIAQKNTGATPLPLSMEATPVLLRAILPPAWCGLHARATSCRF